MLIYNRSFNAAVFISLTISYALVFISSIFVPIMRLDASFLNNTVDLYDIIKIYLLKKEYIIEMSVFFGMIIIPILRLFLLMYMSFCMFFGRYKFFLPVYRYTKGLTEFSFIDIFVVSFVVSYFKLAGLGDAHILAGFGVLVVLFLLDFMVQVELYKLDFKALGNIVHGN